MTQPERRSQERRHHSRTQLAMPLQAVILDPGGDMIEYLQLADISRGGVGAVSSRRLYPGQRVLLRLPAPGLGVRRMHAQVRRCRRAENGFHVGIEFERPVESVSERETLFVTAAA